MVHVAASGPQASQECLHLSPSRLILGNKGGEIYQRRFFVCFEGWLGLGAFGLQREQGRNVTKWQKMHFPFPSPLPSGRSSYAASKENLLLK